MANTSYQTVLLKGIEISLHFGQRTILDNITFEVKSGEIIGVVGRNGCGKSTFLKLLASHLEPDSGKFEHKSNSNIAYIAQEVELENDLSVFETIAKGWIEGKITSNDDELVYIADIINQSDPWKKLNIELHEVVFDAVNSIIQDFGCPDASKIVNSLSGGEKRKVAMAKILVSKPDLLLLDEPTNHLDLDSIKLLEQNLKKYPKAVILVSHDRYFLDQITNKMIEVFDGKLFIHSGNYQEFLIDKAKRVEIATIEDERRVAFLKRELNWVRAGVKARGTKDKGRMQRFQDLKNQKGALIEKNPELLLPDILPLGNKIINFEDTALSIGNKKIVQDLNFSFQQGDRIGLIGSNGSGKTTLIKAILGKTNLEAGKIVVGQNTSFCYQDQEKTNLDLEKNPFEEIGQGQESIDFGSKTISTRGYLRRLLFSNQQIMTKIKYFSGGERARVVLAKILHKGGNFLILDEPTNDLDLETIRLLEESLLNFDGCGIIVSHDRYFLNRVCTHILSIEGDGKYVLISGNYEDYEARKARLYTPILAETSEPTTSDESEIKPKQSAKELRLKEKNLKNIEKKIETLERQISVLEGEFYDPVFYNQKMEIINSKIENHLKLKASLDQLVQEWEKLI